MPEIKSLVEAKLEEAKTADRVSAFKAEKAIEAAGVSDDLREQLEDVADTQVKAKGRISRPTALLIDKSASMEQAIELGKRIGAMISAVCEKELFYVRLRHDGLRDRAGGHDLADWERAFRGHYGRRLHVVWCGFEVPGAEEPVRRADHHDHRRTGKHRAGFRAKLARSTASECRPIRRSVSSARRVAVAISRTLPSQYIAVDVFEFSGDYYSLPNLVPMLSRPSKLELLMEIMDYPLPERKSA